MQSSALQDSSLMSRPDFPVLSGFEKGRFCHFLPVWRKAILKWPAVSESETLYLCTGGEMNGRIQHLLIGILWMCLCATPLMFAQSESGTVTGQVQDAQGAAVAGAEVTATNIATGVATAVKTSDVGIFYFPSLHPSRYKIVVKAPGFKESVLNLEVHVQDRLSETMVDRKSTRLNSSH